jgi:hypothetical protein
MRSALRSMREILDARAEIPQNVVFRSFATETVVLNLNTGKYHGLNPVAGRMMETVANAATIGEAASQLADEYGREPAEIERDLCDLCLGLEGRGLIALYAG